MPPSVAKTKVRVALKALQDAGFVQAQHNRYDIGDQSFNQDQADQVAVAYKRRADVDSTKLEQLIAYAFSTRCRWRNLLDYFGETPDWERCGICDNCRHPASAPQTSTSPEPTQEKEQATKRPASIALGQRVSVARYGEGTVTDVAEGAVTVAFPDGERRRFMASFVRVSAA